MLADKALGDKQGGTPQALLGGLKVTVDRNHFGSQLKSFETELVIDDPELSANGSCHGTFLRGHRRASDSTRRQDDCVLFL